MAFFLTMLHFAQQCRLDNLTLFRNANHYLPNTSHVVSVNCNSQGCATDSEERKLSCILDVNNVNNYSEVNKPGVLLELLESELNRNILERSSFFNHSHTYFGG